MPEKNEPEAKHYDAGHDDDGKMQPRACTDIVCLLIFFAFMGGMGYISNYAVVNGDPARLTHGYNFNGSLCGVDPGFENRSLLYYCPTVVVQGIPMGLNLKAPVCVSSCPVDSSMMIQCLTQTSVMPQVTGASQTLILQQGLSDMQSYPTKELLGLYCVPDLKRLNAIATATGVNPPIGLRTSLFNSTGPIGGYAAKAQQYAGSLKRVWPLMLGTLCFTVITSYAFLFFLKCFAKPLIYLVLIFLFLSLSATGAFFLVGEQLPRPGPVTPSANLTATVVAPTTTIFGVVTTTAAASAARRLQDTAPTVVTVAPVAVAATTIAAAGPLVTLLTSTTVPAGWALPTYEQACAQVPEQCEKWSTRWNEFGGRRRWEELNPFYSEHLSLDQAKLASLVTGGIFATMGFIFLILMCCAHSSINMAIGCVEAAVECIWAIPCMLLMPLFEVIVKVVLYAVLLVMLGWLLSAGEMDNKTILNVGGQEVNGMRRRFKYSDEEKGYIAYYVFGLLWIMELANALGAFAFSYAVVDWYYTPKPKAHHWCSLIMGYVYGSTYHLGTLAMGSFLIALLRYIRLILTFIERYSKEQGNAVGACIAKCLICLITCFKKFMEMINKNAYIDVAINSSNFCTAAADSLKFMLTQAPAITILTGACTIFSLAGCALLSSLTGWVTYMLVTTQDRWTSQTSPHHVDSPGFVAAAAAFGAIFISAAFMVIFDHTADTLLYTYCWNKSKAHNTVGKYAPDCLIHETGLLATHADEKYEPLKAKPAENKAAPAASNGGGGFWQSIWGSHGHSETEPLVAKGH